MWSATLNQSSALHSTPRERIPHQAHSASTGHVSWKGFTRGYCYPKANPGTYQKILGLSTEKPARSGFETQTSLQRVRGAHLEVAPLTPCNPLSLPAHVVPSLPKGNLQ